MSKIAVYPGSFDPITTGHIDIINRVAQIFDHVIVLVANSSDKKYLFTSDERAQFVRKSIQALNVQVAVHSGLTTEFMKAKKAQVIIRGLRAVADFEYEGTLANMNHRLAPDIETFMIFSRPEYYYISSRGVKEMARNHGSLKGLVPEFLEPLLIQKLASN
ncbi:MAG: pantetheine-phosphate adenylyltransferase [Moraxellaceae bacterium]|nr:pantetheine-phosphate adenylyltransferase [Pseudobdellovibrionaceae bacterium]